MPPCRDHSRLRHRPTSNFLSDGGGGGIRTPETLSGLTVFKTAGFNRSPTPPFLILTDPVIWSAFVHSRMRRYNASFDYQEASQPRVF
jgi:hypothetical protein